MVFPDLPPQQCKPAGPLGRFIAFSFLTVLFVAMVGFFVWMIVGGLAIAQRGGGGFSQQCEASVSGQKYIGQGTTITVYQPSSGPPLCRAVYANGSSVMFPLP